MGNAKMRRRQGGRKTKTPTAARCSNRAKELFRDAFGAGSEGRERGSPFAAFVLQASITA